MSSFLQHSSTIYDFLCTRNGSRVQDGVSGAISHQGLEDVERPGQDGSSGDEDIEDNGNNAATVVFSPHHNDVHSIEVHAAESEFNATNEIKRRPSVECLNSHTLSKIGFTSHTNHYSKLTLDSKLINFLTKI